MTRLEEKVKLLALRVTAEKKIEALEAEYDVTPKKVWELTGLSVDKYFVDKNSDLLFVNRNGQDYFAEY